MTLAENLQQVIQELEESSGVAIVGMDGIVVEEQKRDDQIDLQALGAEFSALLKAAGKLCESAAWGGVTELVTSAEQFVVILRFVTPEYFLILVMPQNGNLGKARFLLRRTGLQLKKEL
jgi:predicted regulator of Ras-like GTPase activity (Roadblock/LC7/MglB family)